MKYKIYIVHYEWFGEVTKITFTARTKLGAYLKFKNNCSPNTKILKIERCKDFKI